MKAKFISKYTDTSYGQHMVYLEYEYRGHRYTVYENRCKGNIPLAWQHANEQGRIDSLIELESKPKFDPEIESGLAMLWNYFETGIFE